MGLISVDNIILFIHYYHIVVLIITPSSNNNHNTQYAITDADKIPLVPISAQLIKLKLRFLMPGSRHPKNSLSFRLTKANGLRKESNVPRINRKCNVNLMRSYPFLIAMSNYDSISVILESAYNPVTCSFQMENSTDFKFHFKTVQRMKIAILLKFRFVNSKNSIQLKINRRKIKIIFRINLINDLSNGIFFHSFHFIALLHVRFKKTETAVEKARCKKKRKENEK